MEEKAQFDVFRRGGKYFVTVGMRGPDVEWFMLPDVVEVEPAADRIADAFRHMESLIRNASPEIRHADPDLVDKSHRERMGSKSFNHFVRSASLCSIVRLPEQIKIWYCIHDPVVNMFGSIDSEPDATLPPDASYEDIARAVLDIFAKNPPPPGDKQPAPRRSTTTRRTR